MTSRHYFPFAAAALAASALVLAGCGKPEEKSVMPMTPPVASVAVPAAPAVANIADVDVTTNVKTALQQDAALKGFDLGVETQKGDVRLSGAVETQAQIDSAVAIARAANGVHAVHDELTLKKPA